MKKIILCCLKKVSVIYSFLKRIVIKVFLLYTGAILFFYFLTFIPFTKTFGYQTLPVLLPYASYRTQVLFPKADDELIINYELPIRYVLAIEVIYCARKEDVIDGDIISHDYDYRLDIQDLSNNTKSISKYIKLTDNLSPAGAIICDYDGKRYNNVIAKQIILIGEEFNQGIHEVKLKKLHNDDLYIRDSSRVRKYKVDKVYVTIRPDRRVFYKP